MGHLQSLDWTSVQDKWTRLVDWTDELTLNFILSFLINSVIYKVAWNV